MAWQVALIALAMLQRACTFAALFTSVISDPEKGKTERIMDRSVLATYHS